MFLKPEKRNSTSKFHCSDTEVIIFHNTSWKFPIHPPDFLHLCPIPLSAPALSLFFIYTSLRSGSGSGNRSVTCHYWSNSVIRHRALTVCNALYAGTAGVLRTEVEIRFDTRTQASGLTGAGQTAQKCVSVCPSAFVCLWMDRTGTW